MGSIRNKSYRSGKSNSNCISKVSKPDLGTLSEHEAIIMLMRHGYWVAKSCHDQSPFDMIAVHPNGSVHLIDVKTKSFRKNRSKIFRTPSAKQKKLGIRIMTIDQSTIENKDSDQKDFLKEMKDLLNNFPNKDMFESIKLEKTKHDKPYKSNT